jgi:hypothetical protein
MISNLLRTVKESIYLSIAISYLLLVILVDSMIRFVSSPPMHLHGHRV